VKRTPLTRKTPLKAKTPLKKGGRLRPRSKRTEEVYKERRELVSKVLSERPICERCHHRPSPDVHEILSRGRSGGVFGSAWLDESNVAALCRLCHTWVTGNPAEAEAEGWLRQSEG
jgi:hypothetical protein